MKKQPIKKGKKEIIEEEEIKSGKKNPDFKVLDEYEIPIHSTLGSGSQGKVKRVRKAKTNDYFAMKIIKKEKWNSCKRGLEIQNEISTLPHKNIVNLDRVKENILQPRKGKGPLNACYAVFELAEHREIFDFVASKGPFPEKIARAYFMSIIDGLDWLHNFNIKKHEFQNSPQPTLQKGQGHGDIKPENLVLNSNYILKITDFDFSSPISIKPVAILLPNNAIRPGTEKQQAPEILSNKMIKWEEIDLFAAAVVLFIFMTALPPFKKASPQWDSQYKKFTSNLKEFWNIQEKALKNEINKDFKDLIEKMLAFDPKNRLNIAQIREHKWIKDMPVADSAEICNEMSSRLANVRQQREEEKKTKLRKKKPKTEITKIEEYNSENRQIVLKKCEISEISLIFPGLNLKRNIKEAANEEKQGISLLEFQSILNPETLFKIIVQAIHNHSCKATENKENELAIHPILLNFSDYKLDFDILGEQGWMKGQAKLEQISNEINIVRFRRVEGDYFEFNEQIGFILKEIEKFELEELA